MSAHTPLVQQQKLWKAFFGGVSKSMLVNSVNREIENK